MEQNIIQLPAGGFCQVVNSFVVCTPSDFASASVLPTGPYEKVYRNGVSSSFQLTAVITTSVVSAAAVPVKPESSKSPPYGPRFIIMIVSAFPLRPSKVATSLKVICAPAVSTLGRITSVLRRFPVELTFANERFRGFPVRTSSPCSTCHSKVNPEVVAAVAPSAGTNAEPSRTSFRFGFCFAKASS